MKLLNYIKGDTRGNSSREIEKRSLTDLFLSDAIDGYEFWAGNGAEHIRNIAELERDIYRRRLVPGRQWALFVLIAVMLLILCTAIIIYFSMLR